jgi:uncharacterized membrane protein YagU involved in acid resistance
MSTETRTGQAGGGTDRRYVTAAVAGVLAGLVFGVMIQFVLERMTTIGAMYTLGEPSLSVGWIAHVAHSAGFAIVYVVVTRFGGLAPYADRASTGVLTGAAFGFALWFVNIGFVWPLWLNAVTPPPALAMPYHGMAVQPLVGHLVWGGILGALFPALESLRG